ncbi:hypothetical protein BY458DRAFT_487629 [Sporodiniella umbellata]|nr:hypothetical protein BY458DRAFT_487629 [Sporodiniella umbellata]
MSEFRAIRSVSQLRLFEVEYGVKLCIKQQPRNNQHIKRVYYGRNKGDVPIFVRVNPDTRILADMLGVRLLHPRKDYHEKSPASQAASTCNPSTHPSSSSSALSQPNFRVGFLSGQRSSATVKTEEKKPYNHWRKSSHDNNTPDTTDSQNLLYFISSSSAIGKRSSDYFNETQSKKRKTDSLEGDLFGPMPTLATHFHQYKEEKDMLLSDDSIFQELEKITSSNSNNSSCLLSPPNSPVLSFSNSLEELDDDFVLFP